MENTEHFSMKLDEVTKRHLEAMAETDMRSMSALVRWIVAREWKRRVENNPTLAEVDMAGGQWLNEA